jgi:hypothetical protein
MCHVRFNFEVRIISEQTDRKIIGTKAIELAFLWHLGAQEREIT